MWVASQCFTNGLFINPSKTKFCVFGSCRMLSKTSIPTLTFLNPQKHLTAENSIQDLGVILDSGLTFSQHIESPASELRNKLSMIRRIKHLFDKSTLLTIIYSLLFSKLFYCSMVWSGTVSFVAKGSLIILSRQ